MTRREFLSMVLGPHRMSSESLKRLVGKRRMLSGRYSKPSTGILGVLVALDVVGPEESLHLLGITATDSSYPFQTELEAERENHYNADVTILSAVSRNSSRRRLFIHDEELRVAVNTRSPR
jgi:hypothetical protein